MTEKDERGNTDEAESLMLALYDDEIVVFREVERRRFAAWAARCESPIERLMAAGLWVYNQLDGPVITPQYVVGPYRLDFAMVFSTSSNRHHRLAIECDGHEFHEKTKEQAASDKRRDRELARLGWTVLRFTGSEIWHDAPDCALQAVEVLIDGVKRARDGTAEAELRQ